MSELEIGKAGALSRLAFFLVMGLSLFGCSGDDAEEAKRTGAGKTFCSEGFDPCNGSCVVFATDPANCGSCGNTCDAEQSCVDAVCVADEPTGSGSGGTGTVGETSTGGAGTGVDSAG
jgi:hypothetical protein